MFISAKKFLIYNYDKYKKFICKDYLIILIFAICMALFTAIFNDNKIIFDGNKIKRPNYGEENLNYSLKVDIGDSVRNKKIDFEVSPKRYTLEEIDDKFEYETDKILTMMLADNESYDDINNNLRFVRYLDDGIEVIYNFILLDASLDDIKKYSNLVSESGEVHNELIDEGETVKGYIEFYMRALIDGNDKKYNSSTYSIPIVIKGKALSVQEKLVNDLNRSISFNNIDYISNDYLEIPFEVNGENIKYKENIDLSYLLIIVLAIVVIILLEYKKKNDIKIREKKIKDYLLSEYPKFVTKLLLYLEVGLTVRNSIIMIGNHFKDYKFNKNINILYEKLYEAKLRLENGDNEQNVYEYISKELNDRKYSRLFNIIIQNIKNGTKELSNILEIEAYDSLQERKNNAKRLGEEASTKLIIPLLLELLIVMLVIIVPSFMGI